MNFRKLKADEIEARIGVQRDSGISLLLYKNARVDMALLDEVVGSENWQRDHKELKGNIYCGVSIWDEEKKSWITKWDCGAESFTEKEKGEASDSFKRACVNIGIGRELYTAPFIWIKKDSLDYGKDGKVKTRFKVTEIEYEDDKISHLKIVDADKLYPLFVYDSTSPNSSITGEKKPKTTKESAKQNEDAEPKLKDWQDALKGLLETMKKAGVYDEFWSGVKAMYNADTVEDLSEPNLIDVGKLARAKVMDLGKEN